MAAAEEANALEQAEEAARLARAAAKTGATVAELEGLEASGRALYRARKAAQVKAMAEGTRLAAAKLAQEKAEQEAAKLTGKQALKKGGKVLARTIPVFGEVMMLWDAVEVLSWVSGISHWMGPGRHATPHAAEHGSQRARSGECRSRSNGWPEAHPRGNPHLHRRRGAEGPRPGRARISSPFCGATRRTTRPTPAPVGTKPNEPVCYPIPTSMQVRKGIVPLVSPGPAEHYRD